MFPGVDPETQKKAKELGSKVFCEIVADYEKNQITMTFSCDQPDPEGFLPNLLSQFPPMMGMQLSNFFGIQGKLIERNKKS